MISGTVAGQTTTDEASIAPLAGVSVTDPNAGQTEAVTVTVSNAANGTLGNLSAGTFGPTTGVYTVTGSPAQVTAALDALVFAPTAHQVAPGNTVTTTFTIKVTDHLGASATDSTTSVIATAVENVTLPPSTFAPTTSTSPPPPPQPPAPKPTLHMALQEASSLLGTSVTFEAALTGTDAHVSTGTVTFLVGPLVLCSAPVRDGAASCEHSLPHAGALGVTATYSAPGSPVLRAREQAEVSPILVRLREKVVSLRRGRDRFTTTLYPAPSGFGGPRGVVTIWAEHHALCAARLRGSVKAPEQVSCVARRVAGVVTVRFRPGRDYRAANLVVHVATSG